MQVLLLGIAGTGDREYIPAIVDVTNALDTADLFCPPLSLSFRLKNGVFLRIPRNDLTAIPLYPLPPRLPLWVVAMNRINRTKA